MFKNSRWLLRLGALTVIGIVLLTKLPAPLAIVMGLASVAMLIAAGPI